MQKGLLQLEDFLFDTLWHCKIKGTWQGHQEELLVVRLRCWQANRFEDRVDDSVDLVLECLA
jgi:hypothetical protein